MNASGIGYCSTWANLLGVLFQEAGIPATMVILPGHAVTEALIEGSRQIFDPHYEILALADDGRSVASLEAVLGDPALRARTTGTPSGEPGLQLASTREYEGGISRTHSIQPQLSVAPMDYRLWPGERLTFVWQPLAGVKRRDPERPSSYLDPSRVAMLELPLNGAGDYELSAPTFFVGGRLDLHWDGAGGDVFLGTKSGLWTKIGTFPPGPATVDLNPWIDRNQDPEVRAFRVRVEGAEHGGRLTGYAQVAAQALPELTLGDNRVEIAIDSAEDTRDVSFRAQMEWAEVPAAWIPPAVTESIGPMDRSNVPLSRLVHLRWKLPQGLPPGERVNKEEVLLSDDPDLRWPLSSNFWQLLSPIDGRSYEEIPVDPAFFRPGRTYYWKVRLRSASGVWGPWSRTYTFVGAYDSRSRA